MEPSGRANYEVIRQLGEGGMGRVYEAVHRPSGRVVAIKTLRAEHGASSSQRLLLNEAAAAAQLAHPGIVELLDVGRDDRGGMFLVMELVRGSSLEAWSSSFPGLRTVLRAFQEILAALATAHAQGIVHGDLKPGNVLLSDDGRVKLTDFGIAHVMDPLRKTERRGIQGTPYYMAPEQLLDATAIGPSTDLYAIGVMLYELVAGTEPYAAEGTLAELLARKLGSVRPLAARAGLEVPPALAALVMELLDTNPRTRPRFAARVRGMLADFLPRTRDEPLAVATPFDSLATLVTPSLGTEPTIHSSDQLPMSHPSSRSLPFSLPCAEGSDPAVALHRLRPLPLVGRSAETERLLADAARVAAVGGACGVIVSGRAGEGKTRLVRHGFAEVERAGTMLGAAASFDETIANAQVGLHACITRLIGAPAATVAESLAGPWGWLRRVPQPGVDFARIHEWLTSERAALDAAESADVASTCVLAASRVFPVYLWLDDVAWSRDGAMELFVRLLERDDARVLVIGTLRSGTAEHPEVRAWLLRAAKAGARLEMLPALDAPGRARLIAAAGGLALGAAEALAERLDEPPLVLVEAVRAWIEEGDLVAGESGYVVRDGAHAADLAAHAAGTLLARRIDKLLDGFGEDGPRAERVLAHAALLGLRFEERVLRACAETEGWVDGVLDRALLTGLLRVDGRGAYRFEHRLFLDTIVERCRVRADADAIHCATADAIVAVYGSRALDNGLAVATLYRAGRRHEAAVRRLGETIRALARSSLFDAVDRALALFADWNQADALPRGHLHEALLDVARGHRAYFALEYDRARAHLEAAHAKLEALAAIEDSQSVLFDLSSTYFYENRFAEAERCLASLDAATVPSTTLRGRLHHRRGELAGMRGDLETALAHMRSAVAVTEGIDPRATFVALMTIAELAVAAGRLAEASAAAERSRQTLEALADHYLAGEIDQTLAMIDAARGYFAASRARAAARMDALVARDDRWNLTAVRTILLLCAAGLNAPRADAEAAVGAFAAAFTEVPHDEPATWWMMRESASRLARAGHADLAATVSGILDERLARVARAFKEGAAAR